MSVPAPAVISHPLCFSFHLSDHGALPEGTHFRPPALLTIALHIRVLTSLQISTSIIWLAYEMKGSQIAHNSTAPF